MARPRVPDAERCEHRISVMLNEEDFFALLRLARREGIPPAVLARAFVKEGLTAARVAGNAMLAARANV